MLVPNLESSNSLRECESFLHRRACSLDFFTLGKWGSYPGSGPELGKKSQEPVFLLVPLKEICEWFRAPGYCSFFKNLRKGEYLYPSPGGSLGIEGSSVLVLVLKN